MPLQITELTLKLALYSAIMCTSLAQPTPPAAGLSGYITYDEGDCALILSVTHGGSQRPGDIPDRTVCDDGTFKGCKLPDGTCDYSHDNNIDCQCDSSTCSVSYLTDTNTDDLALLLQQRILQKTGKRAHMIKSELQRRKLDANREVNEATFGHPETVQAYDTFHYYIELAKSQIVAPNYGLVLDIHGQTHVEQWTEFGYAIPKDDITDNIYPASVRDNYASICSLVRRKCLGRPRARKCFRKLVRGRGSLGARFKGYPRIPSPNYPEQGWTSNDYNYFSGGYVTKTHGSRGCEQNPTNVDAIQIEMPRDLRFNTDLHDDYVNKLSRAIIRYMDQHYPAWRGA